MSDTSKIIETDDSHSNSINDEPLDPRIQIELERANVATTEINNLETQYDNAQKLFQISFTNCKQRLANLAKKLGRCVERARPYYDVCKQAQEAQLNTQKAAQEYQNSVELCHTTKENLILAENPSYQSDRLTRQECIHHLTMKVMQAEESRIRCEQIHEEKSKLYQEYEQQRITLSYALTRMITKSKPYFDAKVKAENELKNQKLRIEDVQKSIIQAKKTYRTALNNLEQISEEIHSKRQTQLPPREPGVGAEKPDEFLELPNIELTEFPQLDLSDESSDNDLPNSVSSLSISTSTNCFVPSSNLALSTTASPLTTNKSSTQTIVGVNNENDPRRRRTRKSGRLRVMKNETPLLSHLFGTHKFHSDSDLNFHAKP